VNTKLAGYEITKVPFDRNSLESTGSKFILKKDGIALLAAKTGKRSLFSQPNSYTDGVIKPEFPSLLKTKIEQGEARIFSAGEKVWLTKASFTGKGDGLELELVSDLMDGTRYWGTLKFLTPKGAQPDGNAISAAISEVLELEDSSPAAFCKAFVKMTSTVPNEMTSATLLPRASLFPKDVNMTQNDFEHHTETFNLAGDQAAAVHQSIRACLPKYSVDAAPFKTEHGWGSSLRSSDPPYDVVLTSTSVFAVDHTVVITEFHRWEDPTKQRLDFAKMAFVRTASASCGWEMTQEQLKTLGRFTGAWYAEEIGSANHHIEEEGKLDFCDDPKEKAKFDRLVANIWPRGLVGKP
jgi:hypothetical protein